MTDFELMKAILERAECDEEVYFAPDESEIVVDHGITFYFHPGGDIHIITPHYYQGGNSHD